ncbi:acyl-CoA dehydrogenase family protein [Brevibacterium casei]|uniref:acyl-CoA dehydrogenase family protein n=1 Tax=Brevibacterium casei TaxID=33889 RepID=UPI003F801842
MTQTTRPFDPASVLDQILSGHRPRRTAEQLTRPTLTAEEDAFLDSVSKWCARGDLTTRIESSLQIPDDIIAELSKLGAFRITIPQQYGGLGFSDSCLLGALAILSATHATLCEVVAAHQVVGAVRPLIEFGTAEQRNRYLPELTQTSSAFALNEAAVGYGLGPLGTTAWFDTEINCYRISGTKTWITNATIATHAIVVVDVAPTPLSPGGVTALLIKSDDVGVTQGPLSSFAGMRGLPNGRIRLDDARIPADRVVGAEGHGFDVVLGCLKQCRAALPVVCLMTITTCLRSASKWAQEERQADRGLPTNPQIQELLADLMATSTAANAVAWFILDRHCAPTDAEAAKLILSELASHATDTLLQIVGGRGYETASSAIARDDPPFDIERLWRDTRVTRIFDSSTQMIKDALGQPLAQPQSTPPLPDSESTDATSWIADQSELLRQARSAHPENAHRRAIAVNCALEIFVAYCVEEYRTYLGEHQTPTTTAWTAVLNELQSRLDGLLRDLNDDQRHRRRMSLAAELTARPDLHGRSAFTHPLYEIGANR